ncbi:hypothetical protein RUM44_004809 [Polyplax serrata]|uniref:Endosome-associated-trafficking regulator 1 n=1 Tax=Polyplax serrata TaxID=468196 RepID=A0ABR1B4L6_POLSC
MAEKDANKSSNSLNTSNTTDSANDVDEQNVETREIVNEQNKDSENDPYDVNCYTSSYESPAKREENPFSFKKFLNQDASQKNQGARKKVYPASMNSNKSDLSDNNRMGRNQSEMSPRLIGATDVSSILPDFVQDHLVIEQCYLNGSSAINIDNLNLQNLPDLNLEHQNVHFSMNCDRGTKQPMNNFANLPDFTLGVRTQDSCNSERLPDFALNVGSNSSLNLEWANEGSSSFTNKTRRQVNESSDTSHSNRQRAQISSSPSVPLDLPSCETNSESNPNMPIPFDLTIPADDKNSTSRGAVAPESVSKSLPDFLSDGPIKKELDENLKSSRGNLPGVPNGPLYTDNPSIRLEHERLIREIESLRCQLSEKNRRLEIMESELEHMHKTDQRETASLEYAFQDIESNLKQTTKRALHAEEMVLKLKQENKMLKSENCSLRSENMELRLGNYDSPMSSFQDNKNQRIAKELRTAANIAESSLRSLLSGIENLRVIASSMESVRHFQENSEDYHSFLNEDSASGPAL